MAPVTGSIDRVVTAGKRASGVAAQPARKRLTLGALRRCTPKGLAKIGEVGKSQSCHRLRFSRPRPACRPAFSRRVFAYGFWVSQPRENEGGRADYSAHDAMFAQRDTSRNSPASPVAVAGIGSGTAAPDDRTLIPATTAAATVLMLRKSRRRCRRGRWRYLRALLCAPYWSEGHRQR